jgi:hypothetical protein
MPLGAAAVFSLSLSRMARERKMPAFHFVSRLCFRRLRFIYSAASRTGARSIPASSLSLFKLLFLFDAFHKLPLSFPFNSIKNIYARRPIHYRRETRRRRRRSVRYYIMAHAIYVAAAWKYDTHRRDTEAK